MSEKPTSIDIHPQDSKNSGAIMAKIRAEKITDEAAIRALVDSYEFSSPETKEHTRDRIIDLLRVGAFNNPEPDTIKIDPINTDVRI